MFSALRGKNSECQLEIRDYLKSFKKKEGPTIFNKKRMNFLRGLIKNCQFM